MSKINKKLNGKNGWETWLMGSFEVFKVVKLQYSFRSFFSCLYWLNVCSYNARVSFPIFIILRLLLKPLSVIIFLKKIMTVSLQIVKIGKKMLNR